MPVPLPEAAGEIVKHINGAWGKPPCGLGVSKMVRVPEPQMNQTRVLPKF